LRTSPISPFFLFFEKTDAEIGRVIAATSVTVRAVVSLDWRFIARGCSLGCGVPEGEI
jgi:hypothetical protein